MSVSPKELQRRIGFLKNVGLEYLTLNRKAGTLSGGESQRIRLASQIGAGLTGVLYVLDEPSIGLHQRDNDKLLQSLKGLRDLGNTGNSGKNMMKILLPLPIIWWILAPVLAKTEAM